MPKVRDAARVNTPGPRADETSPLEDQVQAVYYAARAYAVTHAFKRNNEGTPGYVGPLVMKRLIGQLFPNFSDAEFMTAYGLISQVLKRTQAAVCLAHPDPTSKGSTTPIWFIADSMPADLVIVAVHVRSKSAGLVPPVTFSERDYLTKRENRITAKEAGETLPPGEVTVKKPVPLPFEVAQAQRAAAHAALVQRVLEEIQTNSVPLSARDIANIVDSDGVARNLSTYRNAVAQLEANGQIVGRDETDDEKKLRAGGNMPMGRRQKLYWPAPGPVPARVTLPNTTPPQRSGFDIAAERRRQVEADAKIVLEYIRTRRNSDHRRLKWMLADLAITEKRLNAALAALIKEGVIREGSGHRYYPSDAPTRNRQPAPTNTPENLLPSEPDTGNVHATPTAVPDPDSLQLVLDLARKLGVTLPETDTSDLEDENRRLAQRIDRAQEELQRLRSQVKALQAAISSFEVN